VKRLPVITTSEIQCFQRCARLHEYKYVLGYRAPEKAHALEFGTLVHAGLEKWWATAGDLGTTKTALEAAHRESALNAHDLIRADVMLSGYHIRWSDEPITVLGVEQEFCVPIRHPSGAVHTIKLAGKWDAICLIDGRVYFPEHKTKSEKVETDAYFAALRGNLQVSNYLIAATEMGHEPGGALYDVLVKPPEPKLATPEENRRYTKTGALYANQRAEDEAPDAYRERLVALVSAAPDDYYQRATVLRLEHELDAARLDLWYLAEAISRDRLHSPRNPDACRAFGRVCEFAEQCWGGADLESSGFVKLDNPHQELSNATSQAAE
jgi:hypothetical protein